MSKELDRPVWVFCCKDRTLTYGPAKKPPFNKVAIPVFSVESLEEAEQLVTLVGRKQYEEHPKLRGKPWFKITLDGDLDFKPYLDIEDLNAVGEKLKRAYALIKEREA